MSAWGTIPARLARWAELTSGSREWNVVVSAEALAAMRLPGPWLTTTTAEGQGGRWRGEEK